MSLKCSCEDYKLNIDKFCDIFLFAYAHGLRYDGKWIIYCPWCGKKLEVVE